ncbi:universal stress protein [Streptomyces pristinaespiralis]|uniref:universal stress protein n=1 Tax=Streptomyces pristinaespiralis TaxID=38300 RepID=UPI0033EC0F97
MWLPLTVGVDGSVPSLLALDWAVREAARLALPLRIVYAQDEDTHFPGGDFDVTNPFGRGPGQHVVDAAEERAHLHAQDVKVTAEVVPEDPVTALLDAACNASALVTGARGRGELKDLLLGSVSLAVAARAQCPVVVVRDHGAPAADRYAQVMLGVPDATSSSAAVRFAFEIAAARGCALHAVTAWHRPAPASISRMVDLPRHDDQDGHRARASLEEALTRSAEEFPSVDVHRMVVEGSARDVLLKHSETTDLLVVGAKRRLNRVGLHLGRVNHALLHYAACPVAVVPQSH